MGITTTIPTPSRPSAHMCRVAKGERLECGFHGIEQERCFSRGCCFKQSKAKSSAPSCFHPNKSDHDENAKNKNAASLLKPLSELTILASKHNPSVPENIETSDGA